MGKVGNSFSKAFKKFLLDMFPVVLGILIAFMINSWNDSSKREKELEVAREQILQEIVNNQRECQKVISVQQERNKFFISYRDSLNKFKHLGHSLSQLPFKGLNLPNISRTAWDAANYSGILSQLEFEELQMLTSIYQMQGIFDNIKGKIMDIVYGNEFHNPQSLTPTFKSLASVSADYVQFAKSINEAYSVYLSRYDPNSNNSKSQE